MTASRGRLGMPDLVRIVDRPIRSPEVRAILAGIEFTKCRAPGAAATSGGIPYVYAAPALGFEISCDGADVVKLVGLFAAGTREGMEPFRGELFGEVNLQSAPEVIRLVLGPPSKSGPEQLVPTVGRVGPWERWDREEYSLCIQWAPRGRQMSVVTLLAPDRVP